MIFTLTYYSALDCAIQQRGIDLLPQVEERIAPSDWCIEQVEQAWLRDHPGAELISCQPLPQAA